MNASVTWLLPVKNGMPFLPLALESLAQQTDRNFELLAWDNGSTDESVRVLRDWIPHRLRGTVVEGRPLKLGMCLAEMVARCSTTFCARMDADDISLPQRLERQLRFLREHPEVVVLGCQVTRLDADGTSSGQYYHLPLTHEEIVLRMLRLWGLWHPTVVFRRDAVLHVGNYQDEHFVEDYGLWLRLASIGRLANLAEPLLQYRVHETSVTETARKNGDLQRNISACISKHGTRIYGLPSEKLRVYSSGMEKPTARDLIILFTSLVRNGNADPIKLFRSREWWTWLGLCFHRSSRGYRVARRILLKVFRGAAAAK